MRLTSFFVSFLIALTLLTSCTQISAPINIPSGLRKGSWVWNSENNLGFSLENGVLKANASTQKILAFYQDKRQQGSFVGTQGVKIQYDTFIVPQEKAALVIVPGNGEAPIQYAELVYDLMNQDLGYSIYLINHRGQGFSERLLGTSRTWGQINKVDSKAIEAYQKTHIDDFQHLVEDLKYFIENVVKPSTHKKVFALGHSLGGAVLTRYLQQNTARLAAVALISPAHKIVGVIPTIVGDLATRTLVENRVGAGSAAEYALGQEASYSPNQPFSTEGKLNSLTTSRNRFEMRRFITQENPAIAMGGKTWGWFNEMFKASDRIKEYVANIRDPVLILQTTSDQLVSTTSHNEVCSAINRTVEQGRPLLCTVVNFEGGQHELLREKDEIRNAVLDHIVVFFQRYQ